MKKKAFLTILTLLLLSVSATRAQENIGVGGMVGTSFYLGDLNPSLPFYKPGLYVGGFVHYAFTEYYGLRVSMGGGNFRGVAPADPASYLDNYRLMANTPNQMATSFNQSYLHLDARFEMGFLPYDPLDHNADRNNIAPYYAVGVGFAYCNGSPFVQLPLSIGVKYRVAFRFTLGAEWTFCKTFNDRLDGWENIRPASTLPLSNSDWISYFGLHLTYQLGSKELCPANM
ncbi:MAG: DUF6089 family protein [Prevotellaceae bacterium]|jgi:hypothetical protein|nr:DUF6089 family protein [Prevotellaceae bacterium]